MRHVYMTASSDIWRTDGMSKEGKCLDYEFRRRVRECASTEQPAFIDWRDSDPSCFVTATVSPPDPFEFFQDNEQRFQSM